MDSLNTLRPLLALALVLAASARVTAAPFLVEDGRPCAEIVIAEGPTRMARVAAHEFRQQIEKITGARLPIVTRPSGHAVKVFIGASDACPVKADGLPHGAYRISTGADWMALIGEDGDFTPAMPFARNNSDIPRAQTEWEKIVGAPYGLPNPGLYKHRLRLPGDTGKPDGAPTAKNETLDIWGLDERGSFNAVCGYLHRLGARWYLPGEIGEVLPSMKNIELPKLDETVRPDFRLRQFNFRFGVVGADTAMWAMRLGIRNDERLQIAHGMATMTNREAVFARHPDWFAIYGGKPDFKPGDSKCQLCYSNDELFRETLRWARAQLDTFHFETVSIMPPDGYTSICQCEKCKGKDSPERHERGLLSDYVWDFVNRVAKELSKTHPRAKVLNCAYGAYSLPPLKIAKLEPNVQVCIVGGRRPIHKAANKREGEAAPEALRAAWAQKSSNPLLIFENYPFTDRGWYLPSFDAPALVDTVKAAKGVSEGEDIWITVRPDFNTRGIGMNHFLVYFTARAYWGGGEVDADAMLREYCRLFYGPAEAEMLAFFRHCATAWSAMEEDKAKADEALALFEKANAKADAASVFGKRIASVGEYLKGLRMKSQQLGQKRGPVPVVRLVGDAEGVLIDGKLDDAYWQNCPVAATGRLRELQTGRAPALGTSFKAGWQGNHLYFAIRCNEHPGEKPHVTSTRHGDQALWRYGRSPLATAEDKRFIADTLGKIAARMERNDWRILVEDGSAQAHVGFTWKQFTTTGAISLLSALAMVADATGDSHWRGEYERFSAEKDGERWSKWLHPDALPGGQPFTLYANQFSQALTALRRCEKDAARQRQIAEFQRQWAIRALESNVFDTNYWRRLDWAGERDEAATQALLAPLGLDLKKPMTVLELFDACDRKLWEQPVAQAFGTMHKLCYGLATVALHGALLSGDEELARRVKPAVERMVAEFAQHHAAYEGGENLNRAIILGLLALAP